ncbi:hypothetical protein ACOI1H_19825 [Loktanella sp. DJP18]|uniref:hypothetical protein n=1 Tax=Loktanella sp. DJP18 TaxID=3409788 RepID=UPI003BB68159
MDHPEGERETGDGQLGFDRRVRLEFRGTQLSSNGGLLVMRVAERLAAQIDQLPPKKVDELKQKEAISELALQFNKMLGKGYTIEYAYEARLDPAHYGLHSLRRTFPTYIHQQTGNLRAAQLLLGHVSIESMKGRTAPSPPSKRAARITRRPKK